MPEHYSKTVDEDLAKFERLSKKGNAASDYFLESTYWMWLVKKKIKFDGYDWLKKMDKQTYWRCYYPLLESK